MHRERVMLTMCLQIGRRSIRRDSRCGLSVGTRRKQTDNRRGKQRACASKVRHIRVWLEWSIARSR